MTPKLTLNICKMCLDLHNPLDPGMYIVINDDTYNAIIIDESGDTLHDCTYSRSTTTMEDIISELIENYEMWIESTIT